HRHAALLRTSHSTIIPRVNMTQHTHARVAGQHHLQPPFGVCAAVGHYHHAGVQAVADPDAAAVVYAHPPGPARGIDERIEHRPVGDGIRAVPHAFGLAVGRGYRPPTDAPPPAPPRPLPLPPPPPAVHTVSPMRPPAVPERADAGGQPLLVDLFAGQPDPASERLIVRERLEHSLVSPCDVLRVAGECRPSERTLA